MKTGANAFRSALQISHHLARCQVKPGDTVIDATCGRGHDTAFLAGLVGENGKVFAFDIQDEAIRSTRALLEQMDLVSRVGLIQDDHCAMECYVSGAVSLCMFNLGYLPGGDHRIKTTAASSVAALKKAIELVGEGGRISLVCYTGHPGGQEELAALKEYLAGISQDYLEVLEVSFLNHMHNPAELIVINKLNGGRR